jgi:hypothetical protein
MMSFLQLYITLFPFTSKNRSMSECDLKEHILFIRNIYCSL